MKAPRRGVAPSATFSATERWGARLSSCWTTAMPRRRASRGVSSASSRPATRMVPSSGRSTPDRRLISVLLPAPFSPSSAWMRPARMSIDTLLSTALPKKRLVTPLAARIAAPDAIVPACRSTSLVGLLVGQQLLEAVQAIRRIDIAVRRKVLRAGQVLVDVAVVDDRQRHLDEGRDVLAHLGLDADIDREPGQPVRLHGGPGVQVLLLPQLEELAVGFARPRPHRPGPLFPPHEGA